MVQLIHYPLCPRSRTIRLIMAEYGIDANLAEEKPWEWRPEFLAVNAAGNLPVLLMENAAIAGLYPIAEFLSESDFSQQDEEPQDELMPEELIHRAETRRMMDWFNFKFHDEVWEYLFFERVEGPALRRQPPNPDAIRAALANFRNHLSYLTRLLEERYWIGGEYMSLADLTAAAHLSSMDFFGDIHWDQVPIVKNWYARIKSRPSFRPLLLDVIPGIVPPPHYTNLDF